MHTSRCLLLLVALLFAASACSDEKPAGEDALPGVTGTLHHVEQFASNHVASRNLDIWLPPNYEADSSARFPVVYMHDGQNLYDPQKSYIGVDWGIDETMTELVDSGAIDGAIVVGIWNTPKRGPEYMPERALRDFLHPDTFAAMAREHGEPLADAYLRFITQELKPYIDANYRTRPEREHTFIMGSSMGGLISLYAICEYPEVFGGAGCVSTHWPAGDGIVLNYVANHLPDPASHKIYFDFGTATLDSLYEPYQIKVDSLMVAAGYREGENWLTRKFEGDDHSERAWRKRVRVPLLFLLQN